MANKNLYVKAGGAFFTVMHLLHKQLEQMCVSDEEYYKLFTDEDRLKELIPEVARIFAYGMGFWASYWTNYGYTSRKQMFKACGIEKWHNNLLSIPIEVEYLLGNDFSSKFRTKATIIEVPREMSVSEAIELIKLWNLEPANLTQLAHLVTDHSWWFDKKPVFAPGMVEIDKYGYLRVGIAQNWNKRKELSIWNHSHFLSGARLLAVKPLNK